jgi:hypothetical protein
VIVLVANAVRRLVKAAFIVGMVGAAFGLTAGNVIPAGRAGDGSGTVSGYSAAAIQYNLDAANPQNIDSVSLTLVLAPAAGATMKAQLATGGPWYACLNLVGLVVTCPTTSPQATAVGSNQLTVIIAD